MSDAADENDITLTVIRTYDAKKMQIEIPLSTKLGELKEDLGDEELFGPLSPESQRLFFLGRELKSNRSLQKLGLDRFPKNRVLHLHVKREQPTTNTKKRQQRRNKNTTDTTSTLRPTRSTTQPKVTVTQSSGGADVLEIHDDSEEEILIEDSPRDKRRRIS